jgi:hypothetical protein
MEQSNDVWVTLSEIMQQTSDSIIKQTFLQHPFLQKIEYSTGQPVPIPHLLYLASDTEFPVVIENIGSAYLFATRSHNTKKYAVFIDGALYIPSKCKKMDGVFHTSFDCICFYKDDELYFAVKTVDRFSPLYERMNTPVIM